MTPENPTVVLVEDDPGHAALIERNLRRGGYRKDIVHFEDGDVALDAFRSADGPFGWVVVLLDIKMPRVDGIRVLRDLKADHNTSKVPIVMLTTSNDPDEIDLCYSLGCSFYIAKAVDYHQFSSSVQRLGALLSDLELPLQRFQLPDGA